jgi:peptidoglycan/LPS O-acetylase OafA/YrhL
MSHSSTPALGLTEHAYRPDIDGLRAVAVLSVVGFHAFPNWVKGGFVGVDIFFVISGYLISTIIIGGLERDRFSFAEFYSRRIRRIFPALLTVLAACLALGWFVLLTDEYKQLGKHIFGGAAFVSNFMLWRESNYFDNAAYAKPLLHLWSLGIEEQFYVVWPLMLWSARKRRVNLAVITFALALGSFGLNLYETWSNQAAAFYSPQSRFWELLTGGLLAYMVLHNHRISFESSREIIGWKFLWTWSDALEAERDEMCNVQSLLGALFITVGMLVITRERAFPGWLALLPTLGAALVISAGPRAWLNRSVLSNRLLVWFGLISYPLYLWHWPLLSFVRIIAGQTPAWKIRLAAVLLAILLAWCTYKLIEKPLRFGKRLDLKTAILAGLMGVSGLVGYWIHKQNGLNFREVVAINLRDGWEGGTNGNAVNDCGIGDDDKKLFADCSRDPRNTAKYALIGDSKAASIFGGLVRTSSEKGRWLFIGGNNGNGAPLPVISGNPIYAPYQKLALIATDAISNNKNIETVVLVMATSSLFRLRGDTSIEDLPNSKYYDAALEGLGNAVRRFIGAGKKVVLLVDNPTFPDPKDCLGRKIAVKALAQLLRPTQNPACTLTIARHLELSEKYRRLLDDVKSKYPKEVTVFDTIKYLCDTDGGVCLPYKNGRLLYSYSYHLSDYAAGLIGMDLNSYLNGG